MTPARHHAEWLSLVETSGPFLSMPVLLRVFQHGLDPRDPAKASRLREAYEDWLERGAKQPAVHIMPGFVTSSRSCWNIHRNFWSKVRPSRRAWKPSWQTTAKRSAPSSS